LGKALEKKDITMGFASMFEDLGGRLYVNRSDVEFHNAVVRGQQQVEAHAASQASHSETTHYDEPPKEFMEIASNHMRKDGCPSYLLNDYCNWIWQYLTRQKSVDEIWNDFSIVAIPLMTSYLQKGDEITLAFVRKHVLTKGSHWVR